MLALLSNTREHLDDNGHKDIGQPVIEEDHHSYKVETGSKALGIGYLVEDICPAIPACDNDDLQQRSDDIVEAHDATIGVACFLLIAR